MGTAGQPGAKRVAIVGAGVVGLAAAAELEWAGAEVRCTYPACVFAVDGDGFLARRRDHVTAIYGDNLFKFAPLLGALLRDTALTGTLPPALTLLETTAIGSGPQAQPDEQ